MSLQAMVFGACQKCSLSLFYQMHVLPPTHSYATWALERFVGWLQCLVQGTPFAISVKGTDLVLRACDSSHRLGNCWQDHLPLPTEKVVQKRFGAELARSIHHLNLCKFWLCFLPVDNNICHTSATRVVFIQAWMHFKLITFNDSESNFQNLWDVFAIWRVKYFFECIDIGCLLRSLVIEN